MKIIWIGIMGLLISACQSSKNSTVTADGGREVKVLKFDVARVKNGQKIFNTYCIACHQAEGAGKAGYAPRLNSPDFLGLVNENFLKKTILHGRPGTAMIGYKIMPPVASQVDDVVMYIRSWQNDYANFTKYKVDWDKKFDGDHTQGKVGFRTYCASCHGPRGGGYADGGAGPAIGLTGFLSVASDDYIKKTIEIGRAGTAMKPFGHSRGVANLSDREIVNIVSYLRSLAD